MYAYPYKHDPSTPHSSLERQFIADYLKRSDLRIEDLRSLPPDKAKKLMTAACRYASLKLAEIESRSRFIDKIHTDQ